jgi:hypothetical protein
MEAESVAKASFSQARRESASVTLPCAISVLNVTPAGLLPPDSSGANTPSTNVNRE